MIAAHLTEPPPPLQERRPDLPPALSALVMQCLAKQPDQRPASAEAVGTVLDKVRTGEWGRAVPTTVVTPATGSRPVRQRRRLGAAALVAIALIAVVAFVLSRRRASDAPAQVGGRSQPWCASRCSRSRTSAIPPMPISPAAWPMPCAASSPGLRSLEVIARGSSVPYAGGKVRPADVARELGVRYLLTGTVRWAKQADGVSRVLVAPELVAMRANAAPATEWSESFDAPLTDVFRVQADIAGRVAQALGLRLGVADAQQLAARPTSDIVAYDAYLRGEAFTRRMETGDVPAADSAIRYYREAVAHDSTFARAWARLAGAESVNFINAGRPHGGAAPIHAMLARVEHLAPDAPETDYLRSQVAYNVDADTAKAFATSRAALVRFPGNAEIVQFAGVLQFQVGQFDAALAYAKRGLELDPKSTALAAMAGMSAVMARRYAEARPLLDRMEKMQPGNPDSWGLRIASYLGEGDVDGARRTLAEAQRRLSTDGFTQAVMRWNIGLMGTRLRATPHHPGRFSRRFRRLPDRRRAGARRYP